VKLIYLIAPYRANNSATQAENIAKAERIFANLTEMIQAVGAEAGILCVHSMTSSIPERLEKGHDDYWLELTAQMLSKCDAAYVAPHSEESLGGCDSEIKLADARGIPLLWSRAELLNFLKSEKTLKRWRTATEATARKLRGLNKQNKRLEVNVAQRLQEGEFLYGNAALGWTKTRFKEEIAQELADVLAYIVLLAEKGGDISDLGPIFSGAYASLASLLAGEEGSGKK